MGFQDVVRQTRDKVLRTNEYQVAINALRERAENYKVEPTMEQANKNKEQEDLEK